MSKSRQVKGVVVGRKDFGELDKIITLFTEQEGKIRVIAKGVRRINSRRSSGLELGGEIKALLFQGKNIDIITEVEILDSFLDVREDSARLGGLIFLCELINYLLPENEKNKAVHEQFLLVRNEIKEGNLEKIVEFEAKIIQMLGFGMVKQERELIAKKEWRAAHARLKNRIENIIERPLKSLAIFN